MMGALVADFGCAHESFTDPLKALRHLEENSRKITLMVADPTMPGLSGADLVREVARTKPLLPIILVPGYLNQEIPSDILPLVRRVIPKPFTKAEFWTQCGRRFPNIRNGLRPEERRHQEIYEYHRVVSNMSDRLGNVWKTGQQRKHYPFRARTKYSPTWISDAPLFLRRISSLVSPRTWWSGKNFPTVTVFPESPVS